MSSFWELVKAEPSLIEHNYSENSSLYNQAVDAWEQFITESYFSAVSDKATYLITYKAQADVALKRAIHSVLLKEYAQAIYNLRLAIENMQIALYAYEHPLELSDLLKSDKADERIRKASITFIANHLPDRSEKFKGLHKTCDQFGSHQTLSHHSSYIKISDHSIHVSYIGAGREEMDIGLIGITIGCMLEFHHAVGELSPKEWAVINSSVPATFIDIEKKLELLKADALPLFLEALSLRTKQ